MPSAPLPRRASSWLVLSLIAVSPLAAGVGTEWEAVQTLDPRPPLEFGAPLPGVDLPGRVPIAVLFASQPELVLARVDLDAVPPVASFVPIVPNGSIFALGPIAQLPTGRIGGSFIDDFDLKFFHCDPPCNTVNVVTVDSGPEVWIDSSTAVAGGEFLLSAVDNSAANIHVRRSADGGQTWNPLRFINPVGGVYRNFDGGERVTLTADRRAANASTAFHCIFYERPFEALTEKILNCAIGPNPAILDLFVANDVPNAQGVADKFIENTFRMAGSDLAGIFDRRQDQSVRLVIVRQGEVDVVTLGAAPVGAPFFSYGLTRSGDDRIDVLFPTNTGIQGNHQRILLDEAPPFPIDFELGPVQEQGPTAFWADEGTYGNRRLFTFIRTFGGFGGPAFGVAGYPVALFADGFYSADTSRWSSASP